MNEIKVGEYVRSKNGALGKITKVVTEDIFYVKFYDNIEWKTDIEESGITKHSPNIIDLIEVGDHVNGKEILEIRQNAKNGLRYLYYDYIPSKYFVECIDEIKSIVTKEQFKESEYEVNE